MSDTATGTAEVKRGPGRPIWKPDPVTGLYRGGLTKEEYVKKIEDGKKRKRAERLVEANAKIQEVEVTRGPNGVRVKFIGQWDAQEKSALIADLVLKAK